MARGTPPAKVAVLTEALDAATHSVPLQKAFIDAQMIPFMLPSGDYAAHLARERRDREMQVAQMGAGS